jgi:signal transduction histidine kinase
MSPLPPPGSILGESAAPTGTSGRETGGVSELPPPIPPSPTPSPTSAGGPPPTARSQEGWDWDRARQMAEDWFRPLGDREGWLALAYLLLSAIVTPVAFGLMVAFAAVTFGLLFIVVGIFLVVPFFAAVAAFTRLEQWFAELGGHQIELREPSRVEGVGPRSALTALTDPVRWRQVALIAVNTVLAPVLFAFGGFPLSFVLQVVFGDDVVSSGFPFGLGVATFSVVALALAALAAGAIPRVAIWVSGLKAQIDAFFVGTDRLAIAEQRVSTLSTQRQDILDAVASERRRIERNLHDGVQQQLVAIGLDLGMAANQIDRDPAAAKELLGNARAKVQGSIGELRQLGRGLHPAILVDGGIDAALSAVVSGTPIPISVQVDPDLDLSTDVAETVYFVANEAIANVLKHANARVASVHVTKIAANVRVTVHDDGDGGVDASKGTGIAGIRARVNAVDGTLTVTSPAGGPTTLVAEIPRHG